MLNNAESGEVVLDWFWKVILRNKLSSKLKKVASLGSDEQFGTTLNFWFTLWFSCGVILWLKIILYAKFLGSGQRITSQNQEKLHFSSLNSLVHFRESLLRISSRAPLILFENQELRAVPNCPKKWFSVLILKIYHRESLSVTESLHQRIKSRIRSWAELCPTWPQSHPSERQISTVHMELLVPSTSQLSNQKGAPTEQVLRLLKCSS
jgi:hypothetical protein